MKSINRKQLLAVLAIALMIGTVGATEAGGLDMARGVGRCAALLGAAVWAVKV